MDWIEPMEPQQIDDVAKGDEWLHEIKWDGIRGLSYIEDNHFRVFTKRGNERTHFYPELFALTELCSSRNAVLDGEIIVLDEEGKPSFYHSLIRERVRTLAKVDYYAAKYPVKYILFDIMSLDGKHLTHLPIEERKRLLKENVGTSSLITLTDQFKEGEKLYALMRDKGWEGIVSKRLGSKYSGGKGHNCWYKTKLSRKMLAVIGGIQWKEKLPNSLLLGIYRDNTLIFIGKAATGLTREHIYLLKDNYKALEQKAPPFAKESLTGIKGDITWLMPALTCWVVFSEYTVDGILRHPRIAGFSSQTVQDVTGKEFVE